MNIGKELFSYNLDLNFQSKFSIDLDNFEVQFNETLF